jgi:hypothetical protein
METGDLTTLTSVLEKLRERKLDTEFKWSEKGFNAGKGKDYQPGDLKIIRTYRFEGDSNPDDSSVLYVIKADDGLIGYTLDAYGAVSNHGPEYNNFMRNIPVEGREDQIEFDL